MGTVKKDFFRNTFPIEKSPKMKIIILILASSALVAEAAAMGYPDEISPYRRTYAVADDYSKAAFNQAESNDGTGVVEGSYSVALPDGRIQHVNYHANDYDGYVAEVTYDGTAAYPEAVPVRRSVNLPDGRVQIV